MPIVQISRIQHRRGKATNLPQLAAGELGWVVDEQRLYIGNGTVADGAPAVGNTEIVTSNSTAFSTAVTYTYKGYLGSSTPILTGATTDITRTLQQTLDDYVSVKAFGAVGDGSTADLPAIQRALEELYSDTDQADSRSHRILFFPAGQYNISGSIKIPPYAHLRGEGPGKTIFAQSGGNAPVAITEDTSAQSWSDIGLGGATTPTQIQVEGICFANGEAYGGISIDQSSNVKFTSCKFQGSYSSGGADVSASKGITQRSTTALSSSNVIFDSCQFTKFARLVDLSYDLTGMKFINCDFSIAYYGAIIGEAVDGSTSGLTKGPKDVQFLNSRWSTIGQQAIYVLTSSSGADSGTGEVKNIISFANYFASDVSNNFGGVDSFEEVPVIQFNTDQCRSIGDYFDRTHQRATTLNPAPEVQGIGTQTGHTIQHTLINNTSSATSTGIRLPALAGKSIIINYKITRSSTYRVGQLVVNASTTAVSYDDTFNESNGDVGVDLTAVLDNLDSTAGNETAIIKYTTTDMSSTNATIDYQVTQMV